MLYMGGGKPTMKKNISFVMAAAMVLLLVFAAFVPEAMAEAEKYVKNTSGASIYVYKENNDGSIVIGYLENGALAKMESSSGAFLKIANPAGYVKTSQVTVLDLELKVTGGTFLYDGLEHKISASVVGEEGFSFEYSTDGGKSWATTAPGLTEAGSLTVKVRATKGSVMLEQKEVTLKVTNTPPEGTEITIVAHSGQKQAPVRAAANASGARIGTANAGEKYKMISKEGQWYKITFDKKEGYIYYWFVKVGSVTPVPDPEPDPSKAKLTAKGGTFVYDGKAHAVTAKLENGEGFTIEYSTNDGKTWTKVAPSQTEVGKLTVKVRATGGGHMLTHKDVVVEVLEKLPSGTKITLVAHGSTKSIPVRTAGNTSAEKLGTAYPGEEYELLGRSGSWVKINFKGDLGYVYEWFTKEGTLPDPEVPDPVPVPDPDPSVAKLTVKGGTFVYDGLEHKVTVKLENGEGFTVEFSVDGGKTWTTKAPGLTDPGKLTVKTRATGGKSVLTHADVTLTVTKSAPAGTKVTIVAHGSNKSAPMRASASNTGAKIATLPEGTSATLVEQKGDWYKIKYDGKEGYVYHWFVKVGSAPSEDDDSSAKPDPTNAKLTATGGTFVYDGKEHKVVAKLENGAGFTIEYSTDNGKKWTTNVPSLTEAGKLVVKVRATGGGHVLTCADVTLQVIAGIPAGTKLTIVAHGSQKAAPVRAAASTSAERIASINEGETCTLIKQKGSWYQVKYGDITGYVYNWFVKVGTIIVDD